VQIFDDIVVPDADHAVTEGAQPAVTMPVFEAFRVLAAVELDYQAPLAADKVRIVPIDGLLADKFEATELPSANASPQREFCRRECAAQRACTLNPLPGGLPLTPTLSPQAGRGS
jgi:hypothetical protein